MCEFSNAAECEYREKNLPVLAM